MKNIKSALLVAAMAMYSQVSHADENLRIRYGLPFIIPSEWKSIDPLVTDWANHGSVYGCSNWSPSADSVDEGVTFEQNATDCHQDQTRTKTPRQQNNRSHQIRTLTDSAAVETQTLTVDSTRSATGTRVVGSRITGFSVSGSKIAGQALVLNWSGDKVSSYKVHSDNANSGLAVTDVAMAAKTTYSFTPSAAGTYTFTLTATGTDSKQSTQTVSVEVKAAPATGVVAVNKVGGTNTVYEMVNGKAYTGTMSNLPPGKVSGMGILLATWSGGANGLLTANVCSGGDCATAFVYANKVADNKTATLYLDHALNVADGGTVTYSLTQTGATSRNLVIWVYPSSTSVEGRSASPVSGTSYYPLVQLNYVQQ